MSQRCCQQLIKNQEEIVTPPECALTLASGTAMAEVEDAVALLQKQSSSGGGSVFDALAAVIGEVRPGARALEPERSCLCVCRRMERPLKAPIAPETETVAVKGGARAHRTRALSGAEAAAEGSSLLQVGTSPESAPVTRATPVAVPLLLGPPNTDQCHDGLWAMLGGLRRVRVPQRPHVATWAPGWSARDQCCSLR